MSIRLNFLRKSTTLLSLAAALGIAATAGQAKASTLTNDNLDTFFTGDTLSSVAGFPMTTVNLVESSGPSVGSTVGTLGNCVFKITTGTVDLGDYVYEEKLTPNSSFGNVITSFTVDFPVLGFTGDAGYSYSAVAGTGNGQPAATAFTGTFTGSDHINWNNDDTSDTWNAGKSLTFFFVSTDGPADTGLYEAQDDIQATATSYAPVTAVPVPAAASMGLVALAGLAGFGLLRRRTATA